MADKVRLALLGCGGIMHKHAGRSKGLPGVEIVGLCDTVDENMDRLLERSLGHLDAAPPKFDDPAKMLDATRPDAVVIATPHTLHYDHAVLALDAGCHVLMEKPMVTELVHALDLERRVAEAGKVFCIAYNTPCTAELYTLRDYVRTGEFGKLKVVSVCLSQNWYRGTLGKWRQQKALSGGGQMYDSCAHIINSLCWVVEADVDEVYAHIDNLDSEVDINGTATVRFANGVLATIAVAGEGPSGSHGAWVFQRARVDLDPWGAGRLSLFLQPASGWAPEEVKYPQMRGKDGQPLDNFIGAVLGHEEPRTTPRNGVIQSQLMDAVYRSAATGRPARPQI